MAPISCFPTWASCHTGITGASLYCTSSPIRRHRLVLPVFPNALAELPKVSVLLSETQSQKPTLCYLIFLKSDENILTAGNRKGHTKLDPKALTWKPYIMGPNNLAHQDLAPAFPSGEAKKRWVLKMGSGGVCVPWPNRNKRAEGQISQSAARTTGGGEGRVITRR